MNQNFSYEINSKTFQNGIELLFVQLGNAKSEHLIQNIELIRSMFPSIKIHCIISKYSALEIDLPDYVNRIVYTPEKKVDKLFNANEIDLDFRRGYWRFTLERLIAIKSAYIENPESKFIHVESDVLLLPSFPFINFLNIESVAWLPNNGTSDIASIMYFPSLEKNFEFTEDLMSLLVANPRLTDMQALYKLRNLFPERYFLLPTSNSNFGNLRNPNLDSATKLSSIFEGIFDPAPIGMWLTGIDPKNNYGFTKYFETKKISKMQTCINPSAYSLQFVNKSRLLYQKHDKFLEIYNLHIHSKSKKMFSPKWNNEIELLILSSFRKKVYSEFSIRLFTELIFENLSKGTLLEYMYNSPPLSFVRRINHYLKQKFFSN
jgi:hypothetical protein